MTADQRLIERLRTELHEAADEIERLRANSESLERGLMAIAQSIQVLAYVLGAREKP